MTRRAYLGFVPLALFCALRAAYGRLLGQDALPQTSPPPPPPSSSSGTQNGDGQTDQSPAPSSPAPGNAPAAPGQAGKPEFFSGSVTEVDSDHITVSRTLVGKPPESHTFLVNPETKMGKSLHQRARVTVRYRHEGDSDIALEIRVHSQPKAAKNS